MAKSWHSACAEYAARDGDLGEPEKDSDLADQFIEAGHRLGALAESLAIKGSALRRSIASRENES